MVAGKVDFTLNFIETPHMGFLELLSGDLTYPTLTIETMPPDDLEAELGSSAKFGGPETAKAELRTLLLEFRDLWQAERRGCTSVVEHRIQITTPYAIITPPRRMALEQQQIADAELEKMLQAGVIEPSTSPHVSEPVIVKKKTGDWRYCIDFRKVNRFTVPDPYPMRRIDDLLTSIRASRFFIALDLRSGYWQIPLEENSRKYTAFRTPKGLFQFTVMPFGLSNAPATFQRCMENILGDLHWTGVLVYLDDILIHAEDTDTCLRLAREVFQRLRVADLTINLKKCQFFPNSMKYLGHIIGNGSIRPDVSRVEVLSYLKPPKTIKELRSIFGLLSYYRQYIPRFAERTSPITDKFRKNAILTWTSGDELIVKMKSLVTSHVS
jgi:hypothetical protein